MSRDGGYYSKREGIIQEKKISLDDLRGLLPAWFRKLDDAGLVAEWFLEQSSLLHSVADDILSATQKGDLWPIDARARHYSEDDAFDVLEYIFDKVSVGTTTRDGRRSQTTYDGPAGQTAYRDLVNPYLARYGARFTLNQKGRIERLPDAGMGPLLTDALPASDPENVEQRLQAAISLFQRRGASLVDRRRAVTDLASVAEFLRPRMSAVITRQDESDLFNIANNFGLRHHNDRQRTDYDAEVWLDWMFYHFLATIRAVLRLLEKAEAK